MRFIKRDYRSGEEGSISRMAKELEHSTLQERRGSLRLVMLYKVVEMLVLKLPPDDFLMKSRPRRQIQLKHSKTVKQLTFLTTKSKTIQSALIKSKLHQTNTGTLFCGCSNEIESTGRRSNVRQDCRGI